MIPTSVIVVSRHRPAELELCLKALTLQDHPHFEVILVADAGSVAARPDLPLKRALFDVPNIARARNIGLQLAAGEVVAFIDDDAVAGPGWLSALSAPFADPGVVQAAGYTHGPDGIGWQVRAERIGRDGRAWPLADAPAHAQSAASLYPADPEWAVSTIGTNCAFRYQALAAIRGFDPDFAFHLDESDVNLRMNSAFPDSKTAVCPAARVIHGMAPSAHRARRRVPRNLHAVGRSHAIFARKHGGKTEWLLEVQRRRLLMLMRGGAIDSLFIPKLLTSLQNGLKDGACYLIDINPARRTFNKVLEFRPFKRPDPRHHKEDTQTLTLLVGWHWQARKLRKLAVEICEQGQPVEVALLTPGVLPHRRQFTSSGYWERQGGIWGKLHATDPHAQFRSLLKARDAMRDFPP